MLILLYLQRCKLFESICRISDFFFGYTSLKKLYYKWFNKKRMTAKEYWDVEFDKWKEWIQLGSNPKEFPFKDWSFPSDKLKKGKWQWGSCKHSSEILPEPYWGNPIDPPFIFININPARVDSLDGEQANFVRNELKYYDIAARNKLNLIETQNWHDARFKWAQDIEEITLDKCGLSIELVPWHSKSASNVTKYIFENRNSVINNIKCFSKQLPKTGIFKNTFIVRSAAFMDLLQHKELADYFQIQEIKHFTLAKEGVINKPISFLSTAKFKQEHGNTEFLIFHGGASNDMPPMNYILMDTTLKLKEYLLLRNAND